LVPVGAVTADLTSPWIKKKMLSEQSIAVPSLANDVVPVVAPSVMSEDEFLIAVSMLSHSERMEFLRCMNATH
jgi:hypothetical protein